MKYVIVAIAAGLLLALTGCAGHSPARPAAAACRDFESWLGAQPGGNLASGAFAATLASAVKEAPSRLFQTDLKILQSDVGRARAAHTASYLGQPEEDYTVIDTYVVEQFCPR
jgi:hypothetical protein